MANAVELAEKIAAVKESVTELSGRFASSKGQAEKMAEQLSAMGIDGEAQKFQGVVGVCDEAENGRVGLEGGLTKAHWQVMSAVHGTMGPGAQGPTSSVIDNSDGTASWHGTIDGIKTEIVYGTPKEDKRDPSGQELIEETRSRRRFSAFNQTAVKEDATEAAKPFSKLLDHANTIYQHEADPAPSSTSSETGFIAEVRQDTAVFQAPQTPQTTAEHLATAAIVLSLVAARASEGVVDKMGKFTSRMKERKHNDHE